jgi:hypothetical protein
MREPSRLKCETGGQNSAPAPKSALRRYRGICSAAACVHACCVLLLLAARGLLTDMKYIK